ncbi:MAG: transposase [Planctomycetes bacterium]|nr:transposase [Planctomycetota bacterium]
MKIMAMEGRVCKLHRRDWPGFLSRVVPDHTWQQLNRGRRRSSDPRLRWSTKHILLCWVIMGWSIQGQLTERFREGVELLSRMFYRRRRCGGTYQGLTQATQRAGMAVFADFWHGLRQTIPNRVGPAWTWFGWTVFAVDGSRVDAPRTQGNEKSLGKAGRDKTHPQWWITRLIHLPTRMMWDWRQGPGNSSERTHLREMIPSLPASSLLVADTGFGGFDLLWQLSNAKVMFLIRCGANTTLLVEDTGQRIERRGECRHVYLWPRNRRWHPTLASAAVLALDRPQARRQAGLFADPCAGISASFAFHGRRTLPRSLGNRSGLSRTQTNADPSPGVGPDAGNRSHGTGRQHSCVGLVALVRRVGDGRSGHPAERSRRLASDSPGHGACPGRPLLFHAWRGLVGSGLRRLPAPLVETGSRLAAQEEGTPPRVSEIAQAEGTRNNQGLQDIERTCPTTYLTALGAMGGSRHPID